MLLRKKLQSVTAILAVTFAAALAFAPAAAAAANPPNGHPWNCDGLPANFLLNTYHGEAPAQTVKLFCGSSGSGGFGYRHIIEQHGNDLYTYLGIGGCSSLDCITDVVINRCLQSPFTPTYNINNDTWKITRGLSWTGLDGGAESGTCHVVFGATNQRVVTMFP
jgi:hypothetical protein